MPMFSSPQKDQPNMHYPVFRLLSIGQQGWEAFAQILSTAADGSQSGPGPDARPLGMLTGGWGRAGRRDSAVLLS